MIYIALEWVVPRGSRRGVEREKFDGGGLEVVLLCDEGGFVIGIVVWGIAR